MNIRGIPPFGSQLTARCRAIGAFFEASDADVVCFQEVYTWYHLRQLASQLRSFRHVSFQRTVAGPAGDLVTFSRLPLSAQTYRGFGRCPATPGISRLTRLRARMNGALVTRLAQPAVSVINTHPSANTDGDWSPTSRFRPLQHAQLTALAEVVRSAPAPVVVCGDFNVARDSALFAQFIADAALGDAFAGACPPTFRAEYLPAGATMHCIDFILAGAEIRGEAAEVLFAGKTALGSGTGFVSDHLGLLARLDCPGA
jgi:endonuclease/exonuclease/phosphatase family metal-dependent hydrolase